jgi:hypothetical protein
LPFFGDACHVTPLLLDFMPYKFATVMMLSAATIIATLTVDAAPSPPPLPVQLSTDAAWVGTFGPQAIRGDGVTFHTWSASNGIWVGARYDTGRLDRFRLIATTIGDDHNSAAIGIRPDGRLVVAYSRHNEGVLRTRVSINPGDVRSWSTAVAAARGTITYPQLTYLSAEGRWFLFYRNGNTTDGPLEMVTSADGRTWSPQTRLTADTDRSHYTAMGSNGVDRIELLVSNGHPRVGGTPLYHLRYQAGSGWWNSTTPIGPPPFTFNRLTRVYDGTMAASVWDIRPAGNGAVAAFTTFPSWSDHRYQYARLDGGVWTVHEVARAGGSIDPSGTQPSYSGGITIDTADPNMVTLSRQTGSATWTVERRTTADGGTTWSTPQVLATTGKNMRPEAVWGEAGGVMWFTGRYDGFRNFTATGYYQRS